MVRTLGLSPHRKFLSLLSILPPTYIALSFSCVLTVL